MVTKAKSTEGEECWRSGIEDGQSRPGYFSVFLCTIPTVWCVRRSSQVPYKCELVELTQQPLLDRENCDYCFQMKWIDEKKWNSKSLNIFFENNHLVSSRAGFSLWPIPLASLFYLLNLPLAICPVQPGRLVHLSYANAYDIMIVPGELTPSSNHSIVKLPLFKYVYYHPLFPSFISQEFNDSKLSIGTYLALRGKQNLWSII